MTERQSISEARRYSEAAEALAEAVRRYLDPETDWPNRERDLEDALRAFDEARKASE